MSSPRYYPQKETLSWAKGNTFFMQKTSMHQREKFLGKMSPFSNKMFPRILQTAPSGGARCGLRRAADSGLNIESHAAARLGEARHAPRRAVTTGIA
jgi:hypothetical protein